jgi:hypothetical protein
MATCRARERVDAGVFSGASRERRGDLSGELHGTVEMKTP